MDDKHEIRRNDDGSVDEVVTWGWIHIEQLATNSWWIGIDTADGRLLHVNFHAKGRISILVEDEGPSTLWKEKCPRFGMENTREAIAKRARKIRLTNTAVHYDACFEDKADPPCPVCQAVERGIAAGLAAEERQ